MRIRYDDDLKIRCPAGHYVINKGICKRCKKNCKIKKIFEEG